jgi:DNA topoisomerase-1
MLPAVMEAQLEGAKDTAKRAGLRYSPDDGPGLGRRRKGRGWAYYRADGRLVKDPRERARIAALAIPPAWTDVWISPDPRGHLQASGRDDRGRKQYRYHPRWNAARDQKKRDRLLAFGESLEDIRREVRRAMRAPGLGHAKVAAAVVTLLEAAAIRVGNDEYTRSNGTYGLTTLRDRHITVSGPSIEFRFVAKGGQEEGVVIEDPKTARVVAACQAIPGHEVFKWFDADGKKRDLKSRHVNSFIKAASGGDFTAKDLRTWVGTRHAYRYLLDRGPPGADTDVDQCCIAAVDSVAELLRDTREVARSAYIHQGVLDAYKDGTLHGKRTEAGARTNGSLLSDDERDLLRLLGRLQGNSK